MQKHITAIHGKSQIKQSQKLIERLKQENEQLRQTLAEVSATGITMMHHTHRSDCSFSRDFLKSVLAIAQEIKAQEVGDVYQMGYDTAMQPSVMEQSNFNSLNEG